MKRKHIRFHAAHERNHTTFGALEMKTVAFRVKVAEIGLLLMARKKT